MKIKLYIYLPFILCLFGFTPSNNINSDAIIHFYEGNLDDAKALAGIEGKLAFVEFYASWCSPCKWMEKTTFKDSKVVGMLNENYIPIKVNIDDFDGYAWKQEYDISTLPTLLIFNSKGRMIERIEETVSAKELLEILEEHNYDDNRVHVRHQMNKSPDQIRKSAKKAREYKRSTSERSRYVVSTEKSSYKLEVGIYTEYESALDAYQSLNQQFVEPIIVLNDIKKGETRFKIMMGDFKTEQEAVEFQDILRNKFSIESRVI